MRKQESEAKEEEEARRKKDEEARKRTKQQQKTRINKNNYAPLGFELRLHYRGQKLLVNEQKLTKASKSKFVCLTFV